MVNILLLFAIQFLPGFHHLIFKYIFQKKDEYKIIEHRFEFDELSKYSKWWQEKISNGLKDLPEEWIDKIV